jgi:hypothetical protein
VSNLSAFSDGLRVLRTILAERRRSTQAVRARAIAVATPAAIGRTAYSDAPTWPMLVGQPIGQQWVSPESAAQGTAE